MGSASGKSDLRGAATHLERGLARYDEGDLAGALIAFEEALKLYPDASRGKQFADWVQKVHLIATGGGAPALDEEALRAVDEALAEPKSTKAKRPPELSVPGEAMAPERARKATQPPPTPPAVSERERLPEAMAAERARKATQPPTTPPAVSERERLPEAMAPERAGKATQPPTLPPAVSEDVSMNRASDARRGEARRGSARRGGTGKSPPDRLESSRFIDRSRARAAARSDGAGARAQSDAAAADAAGSE